MIWKRFDTQQPINECQYLTCNIYNGTPLYRVLRWSNDLYETDRYDFWNSKGKSGFYYYESEWGFVAATCQLWTEIDSPRFEMGD